MNKVAKFYQTLTQTPRSPKHGKHRRPNPTAYGCSTDGTNRSSRRASADKSDTVTVSWSSFNRYALRTIEEPEPPAIPYAGVRTGEIIGHRLWWIINKDGEDYLCSIAHRRLWTPGETVYGNVDEPVMMDLVLLFDHIWGGTYAFSDVIAFVLEVEEMKRLTGMVRDFGGDFVVFPFPFPQWCALKETTSFAAGRIKMWGEVIEHEKGYRAEYAKLLAIDAVFGDCDIDKLREKYLGGK